MTKKHNAIVFHKVRECCAAGIIRVGWVDGKSNPAVLFTKVLPAVKRGWMVKFICGGRASRPRDGGDTRDEVPVEEGGSELGSELG